MTQHFITFSMYPPGIRTYVRLYVILIDNHQIIFCYKFNNICLFFCYCLYAQEFPTPQFVDKSNTPICPLNLPWQNVKAT